MSRLGETQASAEASVTASTDAVTLAFTPPTGPEGAQALHYKVYNSTSTGTETLLGIVDAYFLDSAGAKWATTSIVDTGTYLLPKNGSNVPATTPTAYYYGNTGMKPLGTGTQNIYLISRNPDYIVRPYVREMTPVNLYPTTSSPDSLPFAFVCDTTLAVRAPKYGVRLANVSCAVDVTAGSGIAPTNSSYSPTPVTV
jgi:hypothetical protein